MMILRSATLRCLSGLTVSAFSILGFSPASSQAPVAPASSTALTSPASASQNEAAQPPIPIRFTLPQAGYVTLVIEDVQGKRVRNLVAETFLPQGENTLYWDGLDDIGRDPEVARAGSSAIPGKLVGPGQYAVRGLVRPAVEARYEMSVYSHGRPPWRTAEKSSEWLTNHTPPSAVLWVPAAGLRRCA
ncbi:MAG: hypothetical protein JWN98_985 [Abditibacteriota bacterium]|nr:hypothetical protein [Abditibacteriota bacterium]